MMLLQKNVSIPGSQNMRQLPCRLMPVMEWTVSLMILALVAMAWM
jgi:hypothetical protein